MERAQQTPALVIRLLASYVAVLIGIWILEFILMLVMNIDSSSSGIVVTVLAAMVPGDIYFRRTSQLPSHGFGWRIAIGFALSSLCVSALQIALSISLGNAQALKIAGDFNFLLLVLLLHLIIIGPLKWCFGWGASSRQRAIEKKAAQASLAEQQKAAHD